MTRIVTGKPTMATPIMSMEMKYITVNPTWNVPPSIVMHEYLPALAADPTVLARMGLRMSYNPDGSVHISQPPGDHNALTPREQEVIGFVTAGLMNKQIAAELGVSEITVKVHRGKAMKKMGARSLADLVRMAETLGIRRRKP